MKTMASFASKVENFWYYNKWKVIASIFIVIVIVMCIAQCASLKDHDYKIVLYTYSEFSEEQLEKMGEYLAEAGEDLNGDGKVTVGFNDCSYDKQYSHPQLIKNNTYKLQSTIISEKEQVIYITDENSFKHIMGLSNEECLFEDISLPDDNGLSYVLPDDLYEFTTVNGLTPKKGLRVSIRKLNESDKMNEKAAENHGKSKEFIKKLVEIKK